MDPKPPGDRSQREALVSQVERASEVNVMLARTAQALTLRPSPPDASHDTVTDQVTLELRDRGEHVEE